MQLDRRSWDLAAAQGGVISPRQVETLGFTTHMRESRVRTGMWEPVGRLGYRLIRMDDEKNLLRAAVILLPGAVVSHCSASRVHGFPVPATEPTVTVHTRTTHSFPGVRVRRGHDLVEEHWEIVDGLPTTKPERTVVDLSADLTERELSRLVQDLVIKGTLQLEPLRLVADQVCRRGRPGSAVMRAVLADLMDQPGPQSELEKRARKLLGFAMLPEPISEFPVPWSPSRRFDDAYPERRVAIEWDSRAWHTTLEAMDRDRRRDRDCAIHGWVLLRFTWGDVTTRQNDVIAAVRAALSRTVG
jgi:hypothetical protein